ncbi:MAG: hypothetical protein ACRDUY_13765 [Nitriliruptorales bacterium]
MAVALVAGLLLAVQATMASAERRVTGQVTFEDLAGGLVHAEFNVRGDNGAGSGRVKVRSDAHSWEGAVDCVDFTDGEAGWANFAGRLVESAGVGAELGWFHVEVAGNGQGNLPADLIRVRLLEGPYQGDPVVSASPLETELRVGSPDESPSCLYGLDLPWGLITDEHRPILGGNLQVHGQPGNGRQHGDGLEEGEGDGDGDSGDPASDDKPGNGSGGKSDEAPRSGQAGPKSGDDGAAAGDVVTPDESDGQGDGSGEGLSHPVDDGPGDPDPGDTPADTDAAPGKPGDAPGQANGGQANGGPGSGGPGSGKGKNRD